MTEERTGIRQGFTHLMERQPVRLGLLILIPLLIALTFATPYSNFAILGGFAFIIIVSLLRVKGFQHLGFRSPGKWGALILAAIGLAVILEIGADVLIEPFVAKWTGEEADFSAFDGLVGNVPNTLIMIAIGWIIGGFLEEMFFRGFLLQETGLLLGGRNVGFAIGLVLSSALFGMSHFYQGPTGMIMTGLMGFFLGLIYLAKGRNIWLAVLVHGIVDTIGFTLIYFDKYEALREIVPA